MKNTVIYFVRHGDVENPKKILYGRLNGFGLSKLGYFQAEKLKEFFADKKYSVFFASPLTRAQQTAQIIANGRKIQTDERINEIDISEWEGLRKEQRGAKELDSYLNHPQFFSGHGETVIAVVDRTRDFISFLQKSYQGKNIVVVSHGEVLAAAQVISGMVPFDDINKIEIRNGSVTRLEYDSELKCVENDYFVIAPAKKDLV